ncbi:RNA polymerase sigma-70 factor [Aquimarina muelleri]|uniref:RNA polymerase sigma-70 factor n=1 Tax=Aquimarina muelleri TaxID=279356 RepID=UPI003F685043
MFRKEQHSNLNQIFDIKTPAGFEIIYRKYVKKLCRISYNQINDESLAQDIVHDVFKSVWERRNTLVLKGSIENYLVRAVKLSILNYIRTKISHEKHLKTKLLTIDTIDNHTENQVHVNDLTKQVNLLTNKLPNRCKEVFNLSRIKGLKNKEIAGLLLISEKTVEAHLSKSLKFLKTHLADYQRYMLK